MLGLLNTIERSLKNHLLWATSEHPLSVTVEMETPSSLFLCGIRGTFPGLAASGKETTDK